MEPANKVVLILDLRIWRSFCYTVERKQTVTAR